jgi:predicted alpha/beta-hydrolase family hydrolase
VNLLWTGPARGPVLVLAHGAGAPMDSPFMSAMATLLAGEGVRVCRFEFAYMAARRAGARKPPPRADVLDREFLAVMDGVPGQVCIGGKSMGSRAACRTAGALRPERIAGVVCLGFPFHPPGQPGRLRDDLAAAGATPVLVVQGERDPFGTRGEVEAMRLPEACAVTWIAQANHDLAPPKSAGLSKTEALAQAARAVAAFVKERLAPG